ncbi:pentapeptide repeat-containing protein [Nocardia mangyaensis]|uniref:pentapeptide repeat-containing protein n=1 Tax=Nocardia mangyaensis TaxID=2213200 RepID=UPI002674EF00|nr:pentapeptide repeat-containing protein [Nocardia mangyaensis]MDO3649339.1 pentapeptide repeat-containing protein [Nocardia mangyaensis]
MNSVKKWPNSSDAHAVLKEYLERVSSGTTGPVGGENALGGDDLDFSGADLSGLSLIEAWFMGADLSDVRLADADLYRAWLNTARLDRVVLDGADIRKVEARGCSAVGAKIRGADVRSAVLEDADLREVDFSESDLRQASLDESDLRNARLNGCKYLRTGLIRSRLGGASVAGGQGPVYGPADVGVTEPRVIGGDELRRWFHDHGAPEVVVLELKAPG